MGVHGDMRCFRTLWSVGGTAAFVSVRFWAPEYGQELTKDPDVRHR